MGSGIEIRRLTLGIQTQADWRRRQEAFQLQCRRRFGRQHKQGFQIIRALRLAGIGHKAHAALTVNVGHHHFHGMMNKRMIPG